MDKEAEAMLQALEEEEFIQSLELKPKEQWYCDFCGGIINSADDGMLEWDKIFEEEGIKAQNFRIVHHRSIKECTRPKEADAKLADMHLYRFTGDHGLSDLINLGILNKVDNFELGTIIRRIHVKYYEEAWRLLPLALEDGHYEVNSNEDGNVTEDVLKWLIKKYR